MHEKETGRLEAFSDGVFAVAITLLVLNIKLTGLSSSSQQVLNDQGLWKELGNQWPILASYCTSFATIGIMWINHHRLFVHIKRVDTGLMLINLALLLVIVFIPVPTALLAEYLTHPEFHAAAIIYSATFFLMALFFNILWFYASHHNRLLANDADRNTVRAISQQYLFGPVLYLIIVGIAWISVPVMIILIFILALFFAVPGRPLLSPLEKNKSDDSDDI